MKLEKVVIMSHLVRLVWIGSGFMSLSSDGIGMRYSDSNESGISGITGMQFVNYYTTR
jgi:hypothetical protein